MTYTSKLAVIAPLVLTLLASCHKGHDAHDTDNALKGLMHTMHTQMDAVPKTGDPDHDFAAMMKVHH